MPDPDRPAQNAQPSHELPARRQRRRDATTTTSPLRLPAGQLRAVVDDRSAVLGLTRDSLALTAGVSRTTLFEWLAGTSSPSVAGWRALARGLDLTVSELLEQLDAAEVHPVLLGRIEHGWSRGELARIAGVAVSSVRQVETGGQVRADVARRLAETLGMPPAQRAAIARSYAGRDVSPLGELLEQTRLANGWSVADLARQFGVSRQMVSLWLNGTDRVAERWLAQVAMITGRELAEVTALR